MINGVSTAATVAVMFTGICVVTGAEVNGTAVVAKVGVVVVLTGSFTGLMQPATRIYTIKMRNTACFTVIGLSVF